MNSGTKSQLRSSSKPRSKHAPSSIITVSSASSKDVVEVVEEVNSGMSASKVLKACSFVQMGLGVFMFIFMLWSFYNPVDVLTRLVTQFHVDGMESKESIAANSWQQTAIAFGMHAYADIANGWEAFNYKSGPIAPVVTVWNTTRFLISFLWVLSFMDGIAKGNRSQPKGSMDEVGNGYDNIANWPLLAKIVIILLIIDTLLLRPIMVFCQRKINDLNPPVKGAEIEEWKSLTLTQKICRGVFYYEAVISGMSGCVYFLFPKLFLWLYFPEKLFNEPFEAAAWSLSQFGANVMAFGLYQMSADIDSRTGHIVWWLVLDIAWMYFYWTGVTSVLGSWNPWTFRGANFWCHSAFHADSTLAIARSVFLYTLYSTGRPKSKKD